MLRVAGLWCSGVGARGEPVCICVARAWCAWLWCWRCGSQGGGVGGCVGLLLCAILYCPLLGLSFHGPEAWGGQGFWAGGWGTMGAWATSTVSSAYCDRRVGDRGCLVHNVCCNIAVRCLHCADLCSSLVGVLCGLTRSAFSGTAVDTHLLLFVIVAGLERSALVAGCRVSEVYPVPPLISAG